MNRAHSLAEVVEAGWAPSVHYLVVRLRRKEIPGRKVGRHWVMSDDDVRAYIDSRSNHAAQPVPEDSHFGLSAASQRRRLAG